MGMPKLNERNPHLSHDIHTPDQHSHHHPSATGRANDERDIPSPDGLKNNQQRFLHTVTVTDFLKGIHTNDSLERLFHVHEKPRSAWEKREDAHKIMTDPRTNVGGPAAMERTIRQKWAANFMDIVHDQARKALLAYKRTPDHIPTPSEPEDPPAVANDTPDPEVAQKPGPHRPPPLHVDVRDRMVSTHKGPTNTRGLPNDNATEPSKRSPEKRISRALSPSPWLGASPERPTQPTSRPWHPWHPREPEGHPYQALRYNQPAAKLRLKAVAKHGPDGGARSASHMPPPPRPRSGTPFDRCPTPPNTSSEQLPFSPQTGAAIATHCDYKVHSRRLASRLGKSTSSGQTSLPRQ